ncbi:zinc knuckle [Oesophagostomum dentatum]|uniref:Zinc knuckle n=1 Tax=Oesophagostomum dentatum TaxID=61180 RepID=A0A0B1TKS9_OESDE|nr:zinc knuckle [Oesophagostomum dentatum]
MDKVVRPGKHSKGRCYNCHMRGHLAIDCKNPRQKQRSSNQAPLLGRKTTTTVEILGNQWQALLDTGSEVSIPPIRILQQAMKNIVDIDSEIEELQLDKTTRIVDASGDVREIYGGGKSEYQRGSDQRRSRKRGHKGLKVGVWEDVYTIGNQGASAVNMLSKQHAVMTAEERMRFLQTLLVQNRGGQELSDSMN